MSWIIMKSAGNDFSFTPWKIEDSKAGHTYEYANKLARIVTNAMELYANVQFLERVLRYMEICEDDGDYRETWKSDQLKRDINELIDVLGLPEERKQRI